MSASMLGALDASVFKAVFSDLNIRRLLEKRMENSKNLPGEVLAGQIQAGRKDLISTLVNQHSDRLFWIILRLVQSYSTAEDILQDTWICVIRKFHQYDPSRPLTSWLTKIAVNRCRDYWRRERVRGFWKRTLDSNSLEDTGTAFAADSTADVERNVETSEALMTLSHKLREVVVLKFYSGLTYDEIARVLNLPTGTVKSRLHSALTKLRKHLFKNREAR